MQSTIFDVTPEELTSLAGKIEGKTEEFIKAYGSIYTAVTDLRVTYKGEASDAFNQKIGEYKNDFEAAKTALKNYAESLRTYAQDIIDVETDVKSKAGTLSIGR